ncbi:transposase, IS4 [Deinococcus aerius]|uniref:Transposase, IS4 n=1 Tax=Deinococcus aerius TaxID=200253 RepID=A0A2I9DAA2_9DEIO|nr:transposase, IS4 [Deinococcus aerius]
MTWVASLELFKRGRPVLFVVAHLRDEQQALLVLDRTNWKGGKHDLNILLLSVRWQTFSFPLLWTLLPRGGNSNMATRIALVERLLPLLQGRRVFLGADERRKRNLR